MNEVSPDAIYPSYWADYLTKVAAVTLLSVDYIWHKLPYARGLQYAMVWMYRQGHTCASLTTSEKTTQLDKPL